MRKGASLRNSCAPAQNGDTIKKACKICKRVITQGNICPSCKSGELASSFQGVAIVFDPATSELAKRLGIKEPGRYALRV